MFRRFIHWQYAPALSALAVVGLFWMAGALGWLKVLRESDSPLQMLIWLYVMLAAVIGSIVIGSLAFMDLQRRFKAGRSRPVGARPRAVKEMDLVEVGLELP